MTQECTHQGCSRAALLRWRTASRTGWPARTRSQISRKPCATHLRCSETGDTGSEYVSGSCRDEVCVREVPTSSCTTSDTESGARIENTLPIPLVKPISVLEKLGAMSMWDTCGHKQYRVVTVSSRVHGVV